MNAHICGSPDKRHAPFVGLDEHDEPLIRGQYELTRKGSSEEHGKPTRKPTSETDTETNGAGAALAGLAALAISEQFGNEDRERDRL